MIREGQTTNSFQIGKTKLTYSQFHYPFLIEVFILDVYRTHLLKKGDTVLDLGAGIGDFSVLASERIGSSGQVIAIEPNPDDYELLKLNIKNNNCTNIIPLNVGVAGHEGRRTMSFRGRSYEFKASTLESIIQRPEVASKFSFIKMDIEGYEQEVIKSGLDIIKNARVIAIELHKTKREIDLLLEPFGFRFVPLSKTHIYKQLLKNLIYHPMLLHKSYQILKKQRPHLLSFVTRGLDYDTNYDYLSGTYQKQTIS